MNPLNKMESKHAVAIILVEENQISFEQYINCNQHTLFNIGSITKFVIGQAIYFLEKKNEINLNAFVCEYIDNFPFQDIQIKHLLYHESGIINYYRLFQEKEYSTVTNTDVMEKIRNTKQLFCAGDMFSYSNSNYVVLYEILLKLLSEDIKSFLRSVLNTTLLDFYIYLGESNFNNRLIPSYEKNQRSDNDTLTIGDGGIVTSASFMKDVLLHLKFDSVKTHHKETNEKYSEHYEYGYTYDKEKEYAFHTGMYKGYRSILAIQPKTNKRAIILSNSDLCTYAYRKKVVDEFFKNNRVPSDTPLSK